MDESDEECRSWTEEDARAMGYSGLCPDCGYPTINCIVADDACTECNYVGQHYTGTIYG